MAFMVPRFELAYPWEFDPADGGAVVTCVVC
jgi:hypothetical protein